MRSLVGFVLAATLLVLAPSTRAHVAEGTIALTVGEEVPAPSVTPPTGASGVARIEVTSDLTIEYEVTVDLLTGDATMAHIHAGAPGEAPPNNIVFGLARIDGKTFRGETAALSPAQLATLINGGYYVNVHTPMNSAGEVRGQIKDLEIVHGTCSCRTLSRKAFRRCVAGEIKKLDKSERKSAEVKALKKAVKKAACGLSQVPKKKPLACCLPINEAAGAVSGQLCAPVKNDAQCSKLGGSFVADASCLPNPCTPPASPSGAFVDAQ